MIAKNLDPELLEAWSIAANLKRWQLCPLQAEVLE
jgi:hypothetical protein